jgi:nitroimidazol reductase NimA-like FMN-containing flavoprotein (pyridoxamine 5'-phosphate oxidase superfamily)
MAPELRELIIRLLDDHRLMTLATNRPDGWPQATVVGYANEGLKIYCFISRLSQKHANIARDARISAAIASDFSDPLAIKGLSLAGKAALVTDRSEFGRACEIFMKRYPEYASWPRPNPAIAPMLRITPTVISVVDYSKGFGHSDLVNVGQADMTVHKLDWLGQQT